MGKAMSANQTATMSPARPGGNLKAQLRRAERLRKLCAVSEGFVYAVTRTGITGGAESLPEDLADYLAAVKRASRLPVCAGFGVREPEQVRLIAEHADGVIVGSALLEALEAGQPPGEFLAALRP